MYSQIFNFGSDAFMRIKASLTELADKLDKGSQSNTQGKQTKREQIKQEAEMTRIAELTEGRSKIIAYFWGIKLAKFTKELELIDSKEFPNGYGPILNT
jgi:hypothetical protein